MTFCKLILLLSLFAGLTPASAQVQLHFRSLPSSVIEARLNSFSNDNGERERTLRRLFAEAGCKPEEQAVQASKHPNVICTLQGKTNNVIVVGAHFDHVSVGQGVADNWSGASLLPTLFESISADPRRHTYVFIGFTDEEEGLIGSEFYVKHLADAQRTQISAMVNLDTLGLSPTKVWESQSDPYLAASLATLAKALKLPVTAVDADAVGKADSFPFREKKIPAITIHSVTQETLPILHSPRDTVKAIHMDDYYDSYRLLAAYLAYLDTIQEVKPKAVPAKPN